MVSHLTTTHENKSVFPVGRENLYGFKQLRKNKFFIWGSWEVPPELEEPIACINQNLSKHEQTMHG